MITQSHKRTQDLEGQKKMSMQRSSDLQLLGAASGGAMGVKKRGAPPKPPAAPEKEEEVCRLEHCAWIVQIFRVLCENFLLFSN